ncbi:hypothetical protein CLCHR_08960 [Clostridium chromiireducens]|uniref:Uncharacterized protein n=1 Tax=Clostridium chromiireducens TaxID=225345 RepID=A0A1V4IZQ7_9CLOT|nr:hypothetical protein CLCHR_08960 [Clostridium chromiireducens]
MELIYYIRYNGTNKKVLEMEVVISEYNGERF